MIIDECTAKEVVNALGLDDELSQDGSSINRFFRTVLVNMAERIVALEKDARPLAKGESISLDPLEGVEVTLDPKEWFLWFSSSDGLVHAKPHKSL